MKGEKSARAEGNYARTWRRGATQADQKIEGVKGGAQ